MAQRFGRLILGILAGAALAGCFPEFNRDLLTDAQVCEPPCEPGWTCLGDAGCLAPGEDSSAEAEAEAEADADADADSTYGEADATPEDSAGGS
ncbi:MAG: hypothetical protein HY905_13665 [Deltaproteobacteria bacterium]|nr:hypothetical protein [Deltaproteobacteria bacterium]